MVANPKQADTLIPDLDQAERFLSLLDPEAEEFTFQVLPEASDGKGGKRGHSEVFQGPFDQFADILTRAQSAGCYIGLMVNEGDGITHPPAKTCRSKASVKRVRAVFQEDDGDGTRPPLEPHIEVESSTGKFHRYWLVEGLSKGDFTAVMRVMVDTYGSDRAAKDLARVLRLPGFYHQKGEPFLVRIVHESGGLPYTRDQIMEAFQPEPVHTHQAPPEPEPTEGQPVTPEMFIKAEEIALQAAKRTHADPKRSRHSEIHLMGQFIRRDLEKRGQQLDQADDLLRAALTMFRDRMRQTNTSGVATPMNWDAELKTIREGYLNRGGEPDRPGTRKGDFDDVQFGEGSDDENQEEPFYVAGSELSEIEINDILEASPPLIRRYVEYALSGSAFKVKPWAFVGSLSYIAQGTARHWYGPTGLSTCMLQAIMGPTESGKDKTALDPLSDLLAAADAKWTPTQDVTLRPPNFMKRIVHRIASGKALEMRLEEFPATTFLGSEMGGVFASMSGKKADPLMVSLKELLLTTFGKDDKTISEKAFCGSGLSKAQKESMSSPITRPCLSVIGLMTNDQAKHFDRATVKDGLLNRFILVPSSRTAFTPVTGMTTPDSDLVEWLLKCHSKQCERAEPIYVPWGDGAEALFDGISRQAHERLDEQPLNHRFSMKVLKLSLCFALARNIDNPSIDIVDLELAKKWLDRTNDAALKTIMLAGGLADGDHHADLINLAMQLQDMGAAAYKPISRIFHHRSSREREEIIRSAVQIGIADVKDSAQGCCNETVMTTRGLPRGLRLVPRVKGIRQFLAASGRA